MTEPTITKRRVTMRSTVAVGIDEKTGATLYQDHEAVDYVRPDFLDAYVLNARKAWQVVSVSEEPDAGPGGYDGATFVPDELDHELAGQTFAATEQEKDR